MKVHRDILQYLERRAGEATVSPDAWARVQARIATDAEPTPTSPNPDLRLDTWTPEVHPVHGEPTSNAAADVGGDGLTAGAPAGGLRPHVPGAGNLPATRAAAVSRERHRRRLRTALASAATVALIATAGIVLTRQSDRSEVATGASRAVLDPDLAFDWTTTDSGLASVPSWSGGDGGLFALAAAPGIEPEDFPDGDWPQAMYRLTDDGAWAPIPPDGEDPKVIQVSQRDGTLYALSFADGNYPGDYPGDELVASISTDGGRNWSPVPIEPVTPPNDKVTWQLTVTFDIASTVDRTLALVSVVRSPDGDLFRREELFPEMAEPDSGYSLDYADEGVRLLRHWTERGEPASELAQHDPNEHLTTEVIRTVPWSEFGISRDDVLTEQRLYEADGDSWTLIPVPADTSQYGTATLDASAEAFVYTAMTFPTGRGPQIASYRSLEGQPWESIDLPLTSEPGADTGPVAVGRSLLAIDYSDDEPPVLSTSSDGVAWTPLDLGALDPTLAHLPPSTNFYTVAGPLGVALMVVRPPADGRRQSRLLLFSPDLERWSFTDLDDVVANGMKVEGLLVGADRIALLGRTDTAPPGDPRRYQTMTGVPRRR